MPPGAYAAAVRTTSPAGPASFDEADRELAEVLDALTEATNYADWIVALAAPHLGGEILEVGAGHGTVTDRLIRHGRVTASDLSPRCADVLRERYVGDGRVEVLCGDVDEALTGRSFDSVVLVNVLEHIADDAAALRTIHAGLRAAGTVVLFVPAFMALYSNFDRMVGHHRRYRRDDLANEVAIAGFEVVECRYVNAVGAVAWWVVARQLGRFPKSRRSMRAYDRTVVPAVRAVESRWTPPFGQSVLCVGRRPA
jgi:SAM-dependent methyltransferase